MNLRNQCASVIVASIASHRLSKAETSVLNKLAFSGVTLFKRNINPDFHSVRSLCESLQNTGDPGYGVPKFIAIDQEGGRVARIRDCRLVDRGPPLNFFSSLKSNPKLYFKSIETYGEELGKGLLKLGINTNFAPVLDLYTEPTNTSIGDRCFGADLETALPKARAFTAGLEKSSIFYSLKHFPGQGDSKHDTHFKSSPVEVSLKTLLVREVAMFKPFLTSTPMVMISHAVFTSLDHKNPASLSSRVIQDLLKKELGYKGLIVSDDMLMKAVDQSGFEEWAGKLVEALVAGTDLLLICNDLEKAEAAVSFIEAEARKSFFLRTRLEESVAKILSYRKKLKRM
jgi:beta-N-acetylhexosaminidase